MAQQDTSHLDASGQSAPAHLARQIGLWSAVAVVVGSTIGSGIFRTPSGIAKLLPGPLPMLAIWMIGGLFVLCGALTLAEVGGAFPFSGGLYVYIREAYGRTFGFLFGWAQLVLIRPSSVGAVATVFGEYALRVMGRMPGDPTFSRDATLLAVGAIALVSAANVFGVRWGAGIQNLTTLAKVAGILVLVLLAFAIGLPQTGGHFGGSAPPGSLTASAFGLALVSVLWAYDGWADCSYVGGEVVEPRRSVPKAILLGTAIIIGVYLLANLGYLSVLSIGEITKSQIVAADTMSRLVGSPGVIFIAAVVMLSTFGTLNGTMLTSPRIFFALSEDKLFFEPVSRVHPRYRTPHVAVLITGVLGIAFVAAAFLYSGSEAFTTLTDAFVVAMVPFYALAVGSVFVFRARAKRQKVSHVSSTETLPDSLVDPVEAGHLETHPHRYDPPVRTPLYPLVPIVFVASTAFLLVNSLIDKDARMPTLLTLGIVLLGAPIYYFTFGLRRP